MTDREKNEAYLKEKGYEYSHDAGSWVLDEMIGGYKWVTRIPDWYVDAYSPGNFVRLVDNAVNKRESDPVCI